ncbi:MAG TPA: PilZ domain-containing protein [Spongiibacteraceae bacterium]|jgi:hypothetical protein
MNEANPSDNERRSEQRLDEGVTIFVERYAAEFDNSQPASIIVCKSIDISANGLQVRMDESIPLGTILRLCAQFSSGRQSLYVVAEVKWQRQENDSYCIGFALFESEQTDIIAWKELIAGRMTD